jgi:hypothetical protein
MAPNENTELRLAAMEARTASRAPPGVMAFQSVEMVDMRLSSFSDHALRFACPRARLILRYARPRRRTKRRGRRTAAAFLPALMLCEDTPAMPVGVTVVEPVSCEEREVSAAGGTGPVVLAVYVALKTGPAGMVERKTGVEAGTIMSCKAQLEVAFHQRGRRLRV